MLPPEKREAQAALQLKIWYNRQRLISTLGYVTPERFEADNVA